MRRTLSRLVHATRSALLRAKAATSGVAAVEFAMIVPVMLVMYIGIVDVTRGVIASRKLDVLSRTVSDLVSQQPSSTAITSSQISSIFTAASLLMSPYNTSSITLTVSAIDIKAKSNNTCCDALVRWTYTQSGTLRACTTPLTQVANNVAPAPTNIPASLITANANAGYGYTTGSTSYLIIADVTYSYTPLFGQAASWFSSRMSKTTYMVPRSPIGPIKLSSPINPPSGQSGVICITP